MASDVLIGLAVAALTVLAMEGIAAAVHKYVMHGPGWAWHRSHHEPRDGRFELNDLYALPFAAVSIALFAAGGWWWPLWWVGLGVAAYGVLYAFVHDGLVHRRFPFPKAPRRGYLKRLVQAHRMHHAVKGRTGAVSFGFLYAPRIDRLKRQLGDKAR
ncbi:MAG: sterol desaturase family protein [Allosphingosinicella sp.]|uniref:sterol desaturase family protein n=1 Tax=Allosphingosinicella sp. TaxID=2823234 RepID=UPI003953DDEE